MEDPDVWNDPERAQELGRERAQLEKIVTALNGLSRGLQDASELLSLAAEENDNSTIEGIVADLDEYAATIGELEFRRMFSGEFDFNNAFLDIQSGSGGTEAQDWAEMLLRMYLRWGEKNGFKTELIEVSDGDVAGIKSATVNFTGDHAYGWLRTETGVHRLVRKSPFDSGNRRHTSFASVFVSPEIDDNIDIEIIPADLRIDVYRASGAGGQHVNRTESSFVGPLERISLVRLVDKVPNFHDESYRRTHQTSAAISPISPGRNSKDENLTKSYSLASKLNSL